MTPDLHGTPRFHPTAIIKLQMGAPRWRDRLAENRRLVRVSLAVLNFTQSQTCHDFDHCIYRGGIAGTGRHPPGQEAT